MEAPRPRAQAGLTKAGCGSGAAAAGEQAQQAGAQQSEATRMPATARCSPCNDMPEGDPRGGLAAPAGEQRCPVSAKDAEVADDLDPAELMRLF